MALKYGEKPAGLENFPKELIEQYYSTVQDYPGYPILPLFYDKGCQRELSIFDNKELEAKWKSYVRSPPTNTKLVFPNHRGNHFINQTPRYQRPEDSPGFCRSPKTLTPGPRVDVFGPLPVPGDFHKRYRNFGSNSSRTRKLSHSGARLKLAKK